MLLISNPRDLFSMRRRKSSKSYVLIGLPKLRADMQISKGELAKRSGVAFRTIVKAELGKPIDRETAQIIMGALDTKTYRELTNTRLVKRAISPKIQSLRLGINRHKGSTRLRMLLPGDPITKP